MPTIHTNAGLATPGLSDAGLSDAGWSGAGQDTLEPEMLMPTRVHKVPVQVDLVFAVDRTGSSREFADGIRAAIPMIAGPVLAKAARCRLFLQTHGDLDYNEHPAMLVRDGGLADVVTAVQHLQFAGGGDAAEHHAHGVEAALESVDWSGLPPKTRGALVLFTTADTKPSPSGRSLAEIGVMLRQRQVLLFAVCQMEPGIRELVQAADGMAFPISNNPDQAEMQRITSRVAASVTDSVIHCLGQT